MSEYGSGIVFYTPPFAPRAIWHEEPPAAKGVALSLLAVTIENASLLSVTPAKLIAFAAGVSRKKARKIKKRAQIYLHHWHRGMA